MGMEKLVIQRIFGFIAYAAIGFLLVAAPSAAFAANQAALFLSPQAGSFFVGSTFDVSVVIDTKGEAVNTIEVELLFPADKIQLTTPSVGHSVIQLWPAPPSFSNREGRMYFVGGIPSPGVTTSQGVVLTLNFRVVAPGEGSIRFGDRTRVLLNDGKGTNVLGQKPSAFYRFSVPPPQGPAISSPTHPDQDRWYRDPNPTFVWAKSAFGEAYSWAIDQDPGGFSDTAPEGSEATAAVQDLKSGVWYFHLRERARGVWGGVSHYLVKIDSDAPAGFALNISPGRRTTNRNPIFRFFTTDALSGLSHYEMKLIPLSAPEVSEALFFEVTSPYQTATLEPGRYQVILRAYDRAGNTRDEVATIDIVGAFSRFIGRDGVDFVLFFISWRWIALAAAILFIIFSIGIGALWRRHRHHVHHAFREDFKRFFKAGGGAPPDVPAI